MAGGAICGVTREVEVQKQRGPPGALLGQWPTVIEMEGLGVEQVTKGQPYKLRRWKLGRPPLEFVSYN
jgi:hypothetical protein